MRTANCWLDIHLFRQGTLFVGYICSYYKHCWLCIWIIVLIYVKVWTELTSVLLQYCWTQQMQYRYCGTLYKGWALRAFGLTNVDCRDMPPQCHLLKEVSVIYWKMNWIYCYKLCATSRLYAVGPVCSVYTVDTNLRL